MLRTTHHRDRRTPSIDWYLALLEDVRSPLGEDARIAIGAAGEDWTQATRLEGGVTYGVLSMDSFVLGARVDVDVAAPQGVPA